MSNEAVLKQFH